MSDVRMRGFRERADVDAVVSLVDRRVRHLAAESVALLEAGGRVLARDAIAAVDVPGFRRAAMDGYAVRAEETFGATPDDPRPFRVAGSSMPGREPDAAVEAGTCVRIMTGAPMPEGADAVVPAEEADLDGGTVRVRAAATPGRNVGEVGEDVRSGALVLRAGRRLRPQDLGVLASIGVKQPMCVRKPRVAILVTGDELLPAGERPAGFRIADANSPMLVELVRRDGGVPLTGPIVPDDRAAVREALEVSVREADCVLGSGGSSVGTEDHLPSLVAELGELPVHGVAMRPSSPAGLGFVAGKPVFLLPGNPVSCLCAYDFFAGRAIRRLAARHPGWPYTKVRMPLARKIASQLGRTDYVRVRIEEGKVVPLTTRGAAILTSTTRAHGFVVVEKDLEGYGEGETVSVHLY
ncbi:MAG: molybdopterin molybdotransferase MoeA [Planctomycetes bacterium]|nr:molybdopterin molybdotransferase MoeA [Planctomycetota bacterium]